jgi:glutathione synthase/RimK-type ligase-like ATP-grasp enzyme
MGEPIALVTCADFPTGHDEESVERALEQLGQSFEWVVWDVASVDWSRFRVAVVRSTWDYTPKADAFREWLARVDDATTVVNPAAAIGWNAHKGYLLDLASRGIAVVPTELVRPGDDVELAEIVATRRWSEGLVLKPAVSAGAVGLTVWRASDDLGALAALRALQDAGQDALVQPLLDEITTSGETSVIFLAGEPTHAVRKVPADGDIRSQPHLGASVQAVAPTDAQIALGRQAMAAAADASGVAVGDLLVARVDCIDLDGTPHLMEIELIEPYLFLPFAPAAGERLAAALCRVAGGA